MSYKNPLAYAAAGVAAVVLAFGAYAIGNSNSSQGTSGTAAASQGAPGAQAPENGQAPPNGQTPPGLGTPVTGATAQKVKAAVVAKYQGRIERIDKLSDGSFVAHVITSNGEYHVTVSRDFKVTGAQQGGRPGAGAPSGGPRPGLGKPVTGAAAAKAKAAALARYPGTVERVMQLADGSYLVHVLRSSGGEVHVKVSKTFAVTGTEQGMPGRRDPSTSNGASTQS
jgi:hypothetical protein